jgi:hypothetical protein
MLYSQTLAEQRKAVPDNSKVRPHYVRLTNCFGKDRIPKPDLAEVRGLELVSPALRENMYLFCYTERVRFELTVTFPPRWFSRPVHSTALASLPIILSNFCFSPSGD